MSSGSARRASGLPRSALIIGSLVLAALWVAPTPATGEPLRELLLARGVSPVGQPWSLRVQYFSSAGGLDWTFALPQTNGTDLGTSGGGDLAPHWFVVGGGHDGAGDSEVNLDGYAERSVARLVALTPHGHVRIPFLHTPHKLLKRWPTLRAVHFFVAFFSADVAPTAVRAYNARGRRLQSIRVG
jgi:hypothetical protein